MSAEINELAYALDTFYFLLSGALVMWMAAGFTMLESGLVRAKNTTEILTKNVSLYAIACIMYMVIGYNIMYGAGVTSIIPSASLILGAADNSAAAIAAGSDAYYSDISDFFFQVVFVATAMSIISGAVAERMKLWSFLGVRGDGDVHHLRCRGRADEALVVPGVHRDPDRRHLPRSGLLELGWWLPG